MFNTHLWQRVLHSNCALGIKFTFHSSQPANSAMPLQCESLSDRCTSIYLSLTPTLSLSLSLPPSLSLSLSLYKVNGDSSHTIQPLKAVLLSKQSRNTGYLYFEIKKPPTAHNTCILLGRMQDFAKGG